MSVRLMIDMNLPEEEWIAELAPRGWSILHWASVGAPDASDCAIMNWAMTNHYVVFTRDLDFGTMLALTHASGPSVLQIRGSAVMPEDIGPEVVAALLRYDAALAGGALVVVDKRKTRIRILPV